MLVLCVLPHPDSEGSRGQHPFTYAGAYTQGNVLPPDLWGGVVGAHFHTDGSDGWSVNFQRNAILRVNCTSVNIVVFVYPPALHFL